MSCPWVEGRRKGFEELGYGCCFICNESVKEDGECCGFVKDGEAPFTCEDCEEQETCKEWVE